MITIPRETADTALAAMNACHGVLTGNHRGTKVHADSIASLNAHMEIIRSALNESHDCEACMGATCACADAFPGLDDLDDVSIHDPQTKARGMLPCERCGGSGDVQIATQEVATCWDCHGAGVDQSKPAAPRHIYQGHCPTECRPDTLDPDCPACKTLMPKKEVAA